jgi:GNAT superfamily N-acetyltransferase
MNASPCTDACRPGARAPVVLRHFDPHVADLAQWTRYHAYRRLRSHEDTPGDPVMADADFEHLLKRRWPLNESCRVAAWHGDEVVGNLMLEFRRPGTADYDSHAPFLNAGGGVLQPWRRQGVGTALLGALRSFMEARAKTTATLVAPSPDACAFLRRAGAVEKHRTAENRLSLLAIDPALLAGWRMTPEAVAHAGLRWEIHVGRVPVPRLAELMEPLTVLINQMPLGELDLPALRYDIEGHRSWYESMDRHGGDHLLVLLLAGSEVVAVCNAHWDARFPDRVFQALTAVASGWRGRGLAKAVKTAMLDLVRARYPSVQLITTQNAEVNAPMLSINQRLGFAMHRASVTFQIGLDALQRHVAQSAEVSFPR